MFCGWNDGRWRRRRKRRRKRRRREGAKSDDFMLSLDEHSGCKCVAR